jgi:chromosomal replication initiation ATPase DnaA
MDALRQSILRARLAKPLPGATQSGGAQKSPDARAADMTAIDARFAILDRKLDTLIHMLKTPNKSDGAARDLVAADVRHVVTEFFGVTEQDMDRAGRSGRIARIRQIAYYLCRAYTARSLPEIGRLFQRDHTTVLHGVRRIGVLRRTDASLDSDLSKLEARLADMLARRQATHPDHAGT